jgi:KIX domain
MSANGGSGGGDGADDWRSTVQQSSRNTEVREIAKVLASLEPGASAGSKLRLAMQFEDTHFRAAKSLEDYRKRLTKRLKKLKDNYVPTQQSNASNREREIEELRGKHGEAIRYIIKHATEAVQEMKNKHGEDKAKNLQQFIEMARIWAMDLGLLDDHPKPKLSMSDDHLNKLKAQLERRLESIRYHVVKLADPDRFLIENLDKIEELATDKGSKILAKDVCGRYAQLHKQEMHPPPPILLKESIERANAPVPLPTRNQRNDERAALIQLDKMRSASTALMAYMGMEDKSSVPRGTLAKLHVIASTGAQFVMEVMKTHKKETKEPEVSLQDAWMKSLLHTTSTDVSSLVDHSMDATTSSASKRPRLGNRYRRPVLKTRFLFTPGRKTPPNLLPAFRMKRAMLVRPPPHGEGSHAILEFGTAFTMTIYFCPLLVTLRACKKKKKAPDAGEDTADSEKKNSSLSSSQHGAASWTPLQHGLTGRDDLLVWGVKGTYETLGRVVEERLRDASAHATHVLRQCFAPSAEKENAADYEIEILEATALLEFLQLARTTYMPDWQDADP